MNPLAFPHWIHTSLIVAVMSLHFIAAEEPAPTPSKIEQSALAAFAEDMQATKDWVAQKTKSADGGEVADLIIRRELVERLNKVRTDGLPPPLANAFIHYKQAEADQAQLCADMPGGEAGVSCLETMRKDDKRRPAFDQAWSKRTEAQDALSGVAADFGVSRQADLFNDSQIFDRWIVIISSHKDFAKAKSAALTISKASKTPFSMNGMIYDKQGLRLPDDYEDEVLAGSYILRRFNESLVNGEVAENHISIENSADYGLAPGSFLVVGKIVESAEEAKQEIAHFKAFAPKVHAVKAEIYMGCMH